MYYVQYTYHLLYIRMTTEIDNKINMHSLRQYYFHYNMSILLLDDQALVKMYGFNNWITLIIGTMSVSSIKY